MTLIELMVVMTLVAGILGAGIYSVGLITHSDLRAEAIRMTSAIQYTWNRAAINNAQYRMIIDMDSNSYHTEVTQAPVVQRSANLDDDSSEFMSEEARQAEEQGDDAENTDEGEDDPFNVNRRPSYKQVQDASLKPHTLPKELSIWGVMTPNNDQVIREGRAAIRFFPNGFQEPAIIILSAGEDTFYSLKTEALTGRVKIYARKMERPEGFGEPDEVQEEW
jgi:type II secretory pathway pseudopilin PulG